MSSRLDYSTNRLPVVGDHVASGALIADMGPGEWDVTTSTGRRLTMCGEPIQHDGDPSTPCLDVVGHDGDHEDREGYTATNWED